MINLEIAKLFNEVADLLEFQDENVFRIRAYRRAAQMIESLPEDVGQLVQTGKLTAIPGIGADLGSKIQEFVATGKVTFIEELKRKVPQGVLEIMQIPGLGPKTTRLLYEKLKVKSVEQLEALCQQHKVAGLPGIKEKTEENILRGIRLVRQRHERLPLGHVLPIAWDLVSALKAVKEVRQIEVAGSLRRRRETIRDIDLLVTSMDPKKVMERFVSLKHAKEVVAHGETKSVIVVSQGLQVDLRVVEPKALGAALVYFTGSEAHNIRIRHLAKQRGLKINEYGVFREPSDRRIAGETEEEVYRAIGLPWIPPELREDRGELEAAQAGKLPQLVELDEIKGDLHMHTTYTDGTASLEEMVKACQARGYQYVAITDHSQSTRVAGGLSAERILKVAEAIHRLQKAHPSIRLLAGSEVDIRPDGSMDFPDEVLAKLDVVVGAIHAGFKQSQGEMTKRLIRAIRHPHVDIIAHPSTRHIGKRDPVEADWAAVFAEAKQTGTCLEVNCQPERMDLSDVQIRAATEAGVRLVISTDSHATAQLAGMEFGVAQARRGWATKEDVTNTLPLQRFLSVVSAKGGH